MQLVMQNSNLAVLLKPASWESSEMQDGYCELSAKCTDKHGGWNKFGTKWEGKYSDLRKFYNCDGRLKVSGC